MENNSTTPQATIHGLPVREITADRNTKLKAALVDLLKKADEGAVKVAAEHFPSILKESTSTSSSGPDKWTRDERGRFA